MNRIVNANNGLIPHDHPFFRKPNEADAGRANMEKVEAIRRIGSRLRHEKRPNLDPSNLERSHA